MNSTPKTKSRSKEWDSTTHDLSRLKYSPKETKLKNENKAKYTDFHRRQLLQSSSSSHLLDSKKQIPIQQDSPLSLKRVSWEDWNLKQPVDFEMELKNLSLATSDSHLQECITMTKEELPRKRVSFQFPSNSNLEMNTPLSNESVLYDSQGTKESIEKEFEPITNAMRHLNHVLGNSSNSLKNSSEIQDWKQEWEITLSNATKYIQNVSKHLLY